MKRQPSTWRSTALRALAVVYFTGIVLDGTGCGWSGRFLPRSLVFFSQVSVLFPKVAYWTIDYRAEAWSCSKKAWVELDTRPYFPIDPDDKENRFNRAMHFFRENRKTMQALDKYLVRHHDPNDPIGGVRLLSLRIPIPKVGSSFDRYERRPLAEYPETEREHFYHTPESVRVKRCKHGGED
jgi:hypothetical protein